MSADRILLRVIDGDGEGDVEDGVRPLTDLGNAERLIDLHGHNIRWWVEGQQWLIWDGTRWAPDRRLRIEELAASTARSIYDEAAEHPGEAKEIAKWAITSESRRSITNMIELAKHAVAVVTDDLDADPWLLNTPSGTIDLRSGTLRPHERDDLITRVTAAEFDPTATATRWAQFLDEVFGGDAEMVDFVHRGFGYSLAGVTTEQCLFLAYGIGRNGKSTLLETLGELLGDYAGVAGADVLAAGLRKQQGGANEELADLRGKRLVIASETEEGERLNEAAIKRMTGGEKMTARKLYGHATTFPVTWTLAIGTNHLPVIRQRDDGIWRRMRVIPFLQRFAKPGEPGWENLPAADTGLKDALLAEGAGILAWLVEGCLRWQAEGLPTPRQIEEANQAYREESDVLAPFLDETVVVANGAVAPMKELYRRYLTWAGQMGEMPLTLAQFKKDLTQRGHATKRAAWAPNRFDTCFDGMRLK